VSDYPRTWMWAEDGPVAEGNYVRADEGHTRDGTRVGILVLEIADEERALWTFEAAFRSKLADELRRRGERDFEAGERIRVERGEEKRRSEQGFDYWPFSVEFGNARPRDAAAIFGDNARPEPEPEPSLGTSRQDDDIPF
jgi:hypothetical protein